MTARRPAARLLTAAGLCAALVAGPAAVGTSAAPLTLAQAKRAATASLAAQGRSVAALGTQAKAAALVPGHRAAYGQRIAAANAALAAARKQLAAARSLAAVQRLRAGLPALTDELDDQLAVLVRLDGLLLGNGAVARAQKGSDATDRAYAALPAGRRSAAVDAQLVAADKALAAARTELEGAVRSLLADGDVPPAEAQQRVTRATQLVQARVEAVLDAVARAQALLAAR